MRWHGATQLPPLVPLLLPPLDTPNPPRWMLVPDRVEMLAFGGLTVVPPEIFCPTTPVPP